MSTVESMIERQNELHGFICRASINLHKLELKKRTPANVQARLEALQSNWKKFQTNHDQLSALKPEQKKTLDYFTNNNYEQCEETFFDSTTEMVEMIEDMKATTQGKAIKGENANEHSAPSSRQLPRIHLPRFSGSYREWRNFRDLFISMIKSNRDLSDVEKMQYLKISVTGEAAQLVTNMDVIGENLERAWSTLVDRYDNKRVLIDTHLASLFSIKQVNLNASTELKTLLGDVKEALGALEALGYPIREWDCILVYLITRQLDADTLIDWEKKIGNNSEPTAFTQLEEFLVGRIHALEAVARATGAKKAKSSASKTGGAQPSVKSHYVSPTAVNAKNNSSTSSAQKTVPTVCVLCNAEHYLSSCPDYNAKTLDQRYQIITKKNLCYNCLDPHQLRNCRTIKRCRTCGKSHHTSLHRSTNEIQGSLGNNPVQKPESSAAIVGTSTPPPRRDDHPTGASTSHHVTLTASTKYTPVLLATALVKVTSCYGEQYEVRALLDQGSEVSFITESLAQRLNLSRKRVSLPISEIGSHKSTASRALVTLDIVSRMEPQFSITVHAYVLAKLTSYLPPIRVLQNAWPYLQGIDLADPEFSSAQQIDLVLGAEIYSRIIEEGLRKGNVGTPIAQNTALGWILSGSVSSVSSTSDGHLAHGLQCSVDHELLELMQRFWVQEDSNVSNQSSLSEDELQCESHFAETHSRTPEGRYVVQIPFKRFPENLGDSYKSALFALLRLEKKLTTDVSLKSAYSAFLTEYETLGHMALIPQSSHQSSLAFYLPHHAVMRESSATTKVRVVFNGSHQTNLGISINDLQHVGPKLQNNLADVITRWRRYKYVFMADIQKMYRQILVHPEDQKFQRILWRENADVQPRAYSLCTVTYGLTSAPYLAIRTLKQLSIDEHHRYPLATDVIQREIYVDDVLSGADNPQEALEKVQQVDQCLKAGCFQLQKWTSNYGKLLRDIPPEHQEESSLISLQSDPLFRALGIQWQPHSDSFIFSFKTQEKTSPITKRFVLSRIAQLFDPLGWIAPVVVRGKIFIQELWTAGLDWDDPIPEELANRWNAFHESFQNIFSVTVPRWLGVRTASFAIELHGFSDASQALGAVIYLRVISRSNEIRVSLVTAKTRVAPLKRVTTPRLELSAAVLLTRQISHIRRILELDRSPVHLWTDSTVTLAYIRGNACRWTEYVRNRVTEIQDLSNSYWHHVPGIENPADYASRGLSPNQLKDNVLWWKGPEWLSQPSTSWTSAIHSLDSNVELELRKTPVNLTNATKPVDIWDLVGRFSNLTRLLRITAWCKRAANGFRRKQDNLGQNHPLTPTELEEARLFWIKETQLAHFKTELERLSHNKPLYRSSSLIRLTLFIDASGLLRVGGRLQNALLDDDEKHPLILLRDSTLTTLVISDVHRRTHHGGTQVTLVTLRHQYWIIGGRVPVRAFIHRCIKCVRYRASLGRQLWDSYQNLERSDLDHF